MGIGTIEILILAAIVVIPLILVVAIVVVASSRSGNQSGGPSPTYNELQVENDQLRKENADLRS